MTAAEAIAMLAKLPADAPICFSAGDALLEVTGIEVATATS